MKTDILDIEGSVVGSMELDPSIFQIEPRSHLLHEMVRSNLASKRRGTHKVKSRSEVSGGSAKPWRQKGTGRARAGSIRSPLFRGGGVVFGPSPRSYDFRPPKSARRVALRSALAARSDALIALDKIELGSTPKTKRAAEILRALGASGKKVLIALDRNDDVARKSFRNIARVKMTSAENVNVYDLLNAEALIFERSAIEKIQERLSR